MAILNVLRSAGNAIMWSARSYKTTVEASFNIVRGAAECTIAAGGTITQGLLEPVASTKEIAKTCLGYYDFCRAKDSFTTSDVTVTALGRTRTIRRPIPERISVGVGHALVGGAKGLATLSITKTYIDGNIKNLLAYRTPLQPVSESQIFVNGIHASGRVLGRMVGSCAKTAAKISAPAFQYVIKNPGNCIQVGMKVGATAGLLYGASYGLVKASESNNIIGKTTYSALAALSFAGAVFATGLIG
jgi:hypothetical protein